MGSLPPKSVKDKCQSRGSWMRRVGRFFKKLGLVEVAWVLGMPMVSFKNTKHPESTSRSDSDCLQGCLEEALAVCVRFYEPLAPCFPEKASLQGILGNFEREISMLRNTWL